MHYCLTTDQFSSVTSLWTHLYIAMSITKLIPVNERVLRQLIHYGPWKPYSTVVNGLHTVLLLVTHSGLSAPRGSIHCRHSAKDRQWFQHSIIYYWTTTNIRWIFQQDQISRKHTMQDITTRIYVTFTVTFYYWNSMLLWGNKISRWYHMHMKQGTT